MQPAYEAHRMFLLRIAKITLISNGIRMNRSENHHALCESFFSSSPILLLHEGYSPPSPSLHAPSHTIFVCCHLSKLCRYSESKEKTVFG